MKQIIKCIRGHLLDNLDDKPTDENGRAAEKNEKSAFSIVFFFILTHQACSVSGPLHRLATVQQASLSAWHMHNVTAAD